MSDIKMPFTHMAEKNPRASAVRVVKAAPVCRADFRDLRSASDELTQEPRRAGHFEMPTMMKPEVAMPHLRQQKRQSAVVSATPPPPTVRKPAVRTVASIGAVPTAEITGIIER